MSEAELRLEVDRLKKRIASLERSVAVAVTRGGGVVNGQLEIDGWLQFAQQASDPTTPRTDCARFFIGTHGGVTALKIVYDDGTTHVIDTK